MPSIPNLNFSDPDIGIFSSGEPVSPSDSGFRSAPTTPISPHTSSNHRDRVGIKSIEYTVEVDKVSNRAESIAEVEGAPLDPRLWHDWAEPNE
jgi:hypothetical protein